MPLDSRAQQTVKREHQRNRNAAGRERRANGMSYRKVAINVTVLDLRATLGKVLASSDAPAEKGRWFEMEPKGERWECTCGLYRNCGSCHHSAHMAA